MKILEPTSAALLRQEAARGAPVYLSVNPREYHGPHLSLDNDHLISAGLIEALHERQREVHPDWPLLYLGELGFGVEATPGPGSAEVTYIESCRRIEAASRELLGIGARRVVVMTFHGSPLHNLAIWKGTRELRRRGVQLFLPMNMILRRILDPRPEELSELWACVSDPADRRKVMECLDQDFHAGFGETSLALHYCPDSVHGHRSVPACPRFEPLKAVKMLSRLASGAGRKELARELRFAGLGMSWFSLKPFPGYSGSPHLACAGAGAVLARLLTDGLFEYGEEVFSGKTCGPQPPMSWVAALTLGGRLSLPRTPVDPVC